MRDYNGYDRVDMTQYSQNKLWELQLKAEGTSFKLNGKSSDTINEKLIEFKGIFRGQGQEFKEYTEERSIRFAKEIPIKVGDYIEYLGDTYLVTTEIDKDFPVFNLTKLSRCNQTINAKGWSTPIHGIAENDSYGVKLNESGDFMAFRDAKLRFKAQKNEITKTIKNGMRFVFDNSEDNIYRVIDKTSVVDKGTIIIMMEKVEYQIEDDLENNIAYNDESFVIEETPIVYNISGNEIITIGTQETFTLDDTVDTVTWSIDDNTVGQIISTTTNTITIKGVGTTDEILTLTAEIDGEQVASKIIYVVR